MSQQTVLVVMATIVAGRKGSKINSESEYFVHINLRKLSHSQGNQSDTTTHFPVEQHFLSLGIIQADRASNLFSNNVLHHAPQKNVQNLHFPATIIRNRERQQCTNNLLARVPQSTLISCQTAVVSIIATKTRGRITMKTPRCATRLLLCGLLASLLVENAFAVGGTIGTTAVYPNPFTEGTVFQLSMPNDARIRISVYDLLGKPIRILFEGIHPKGSYDVPWDGNDETGKPVIPGMYICVLFSENVAVKSVKVIKIAA